MIKQLPAQLPSCPTSGPVDPARPELQGETGACEGGTTSVDRTSSAALCNAMLAPAFHLPVAPTPVINAGTSTFCRGTSVSLRARRRAPQRARRIVPVATSTAARTHARADSAPATVGVWRVDVYDTSLRDGAQGEGISFSLKDKLKLAARLDDFGVSYIEGGYPGSNVKESQFFEGVDTRMPGGAKVVAFGNTRYKDTTCEADRNVQALVAAGMDVVTLVGKAWGMQVDEVLVTSRGENLAMIRETVEFFKAAGKEVMLDAEHFFDGYKDDPWYAMAALSAAVEAGVDVLVLCDTNGGCLPWEIGEYVSVVVESFPSVRVGIHCHNDMELAVANTVSAVHAGASLVQGCINGYGERTGNANLTSVIPCLALKMGYKCVGDKLAELTSVSRFFDEVANLQVCLSLLLLEFSVVVTNLSPRSDTGRIILVSFSFLSQPNNSQPFAGLSAFAHKGGLHVAAVLKNPDTYQFIDPAAVGNERRMLVSELSGRHNILAKAKELGFIDESETSASAIDWNGKARTILGQVKELESKGFTFEGADASIELFIRREMVGYRPPFELIDFNILTGNKRLQYSSNPSDPPVNESVTQATVKLALLGPLDGSNNEMCPTKMCLEVGESVSGPVDAVNTALYKALLPAYPSLASVKLVDFKVRILDPGAATGATTRVMVEFSDDKTGESWTTGKLRRLCFFVSPMLLYATKRAHILTLLVSWFFLFCVRSLCAPQYYGRFSEWADGWTRVLVFEK